MTYQITWHGQIHRDLEPSIRKEVRELFLGPDDDEPDAVIDPTDIVFHHFQLTDDMEGPTVFISGDPSTGGINCTYYEVMEWE